jgi:serine/threonine protein kinase/tetratricopeptide (TPR) repeat protein
MSTAPELEVGGTLNRRFIVERRLGAGSFGIVYEVYDKQRELKVALKRLRRFDASTVYHFKQEFRSLADVTHPNLLGLHELFSIDDQWYFTMDLVEGVDFLEYVRGVSEELSSSVPSGPSILPGDSGLESGYLPTMRSQPKPELDTHVSGAEVLQAVPPKSELPPHDSGDSGRGTQVFGQVVPAPTPLVSELPPHDSGDSGRGTQVFGQVVPASTPPVSELPPHDSGDSGRGTQVFGQVVPAPTESQNLGTLSFRSGLPSAPVPMPGTDPNDPVSAVETHMSEGSGGPSVGSRRLPERRHGGTLDEARLRKAMRQLVAGLGALHHAGKLHRDLKPSNVMVTRRGRVVVLDFGLVAELSRENVYRGLEMVISGTPAYMAPEQAVGRELTPAADMYALGVMLYEALTGELPYGGSARDMLLQKMSEDPPDPRTFNRQLPEDLCEISMRLLSRDPSQRMTGAEVLARLGGEAGAVRAPEPLSRRDQDTGILGRERQLAAFAEGLTGARQGNTVLLFVHGTSGMGKSVLVRSFLDALSREGQAVVLEGRCYEREQVPYKALDSLIDSLTRHLMLLPASDAEQLLPRDIHSLAGLFPTLKRAQVIASIPAREPATDPHELRRRGTTALRELLLQLARHRPLVLFIDDLQWSDSDSAALLFDLLSPPESPALLLLASYRTEDAERSEVVKALKPRRGQETGARFREVEVGPLSPEDARNLALALLGEDHPNAHNDATTIARESAGSPFFVAELSWYLRALRREGSVRPADWLSLSRVIAERVENLPEQARHLLEVICVAGRPLPVAVARKVADLPAASELETLALLRGERFVRTKEPDLVESFHDRIREAVVVNLPAPTLQGIHLRLAETLEAASTKTAPGVLAYHFLSGNNLAKALRYSLFAAREAQAQYANSEASYHYRQALQLLTSGAIRDEKEVTRQVRKVKEALANTLLHAGSYAESAALFQECLATEADPRARAELHSGLGRVYQEQGESGTAIQELEKALQLFGLKAPRSLVGLGLKILGEVLLRVFGALLPWLLLRPVSEERRGDYLRRLATLVALIKIYYFVDINKLTWATLVLNNMAQRVRSDYASSLARSYYGTLLFGAGFLEGSVKNCESGVELARRAKDPATEAIALCRLGIQATFANKLSRAVMLHEQAGGMLRQVGEMWELQTSLMMLATSRFLKSEFKAAEEIYIEMGALGLQLNALMHQGWSHAWAPFCRYLLGTQDAASVSAEIEKAHGISVQVKDLANQCAALNHLANIAVREEQPEEAAQLADRVFRSIWRYHVLVPFLQIGLVDTAEAALYALETGATSVKRSRLLKIVRLSLLKAQFVAGRYPYLAGPTLRVKARYARLRGRTQEAESLFRRALEVLKDTPNRWEKGVVCYDAAVALPHLREEMLEKAEVIFTAIGAEAELRRVRRLTEAPAEPSRANGRARSIR